MRPPVCAICEKGFRPGRGEAGGQLVEFADYEPAAPCRVGHPRGLVWVCEEHRISAERMSHLDAGKAIGLLRRWFRRR